MERLFQQQQLVAAAEAMQAAGNLSPDVQHQLMNILAAGTLNSSGAAQFNMKPEYGQHVYGRHQGHAGGVMPGMSMPPHGMLQSAGHHPVPVNPLGMMDMHLPGAMPHAHLPFCPSPSSSSLSTGAESLGCMSEEDGSSKRRGTSDGVFIFTRRRAGQKERTSNEPVALSKKRLQVLVAHTYLHPYPIVQPKSRNPRGEDLAQDPRTQICRAPSAEFFPPPSAGAL